MSAILQTVDRGSGTEGLTSLVERLRQESEGLRSALRGAAPLQQAIGVVMERFSLDAADAFERLLRVAAESERTVAEVADDLVSARSGRCGGGSAAVSVTVTHDDDRDGGDLQAAFQQCAATLPMGTTAQQALEVLAGIGLRPLRISCAAVFVSGAGGWLMRAAASPDDWLLEWPGVPHDDRIPASVAGHGGQAIWLTDEAAWERHFPEFTVAGTRALACLPMRRGGEVTGALVIGWADHPELGRSSRRHALAIADLAADALHRTLGPAPASRQESDLAADPARALVDTGLHPMALLHPIYEAGGELVDFDVDWVATPQPDDRLRSLGGSRLMERLPCLHGSPVEQLLHAAMTMGVRQHLEDVFVGGLSADGRRTRVSVTAAPFAEGLLVGWVDHDDEDQRLEAVAVELNERRVQATRDRQAIEVMQRSVLPEEDHLKLDGVDIMARYLPVPGDPLGGDWYDVFAHGGLVWLSVGDVAGHGVTAAAHMSQLRNAARGVIVSGADPASVCSVLNRLSLTFPTATTATCIVGALDPSRRQWTWASAGHPPPVILRPDAPPRLLSSPRGLLLGADERATYRLASCSLPKDGTLLLMTDGMFERPGEPVDIGLHRLLDGIPRGDVMDIGDRIAQALPPSHRDDACFLLARCRPEHDVA